MRRSGAIGLIVACAGAAAVWWLWRPVEEPGGGDRAPLAEEVSLDPVEDTRRIRVSNVRHTETGIEFEAAMEVVGRGRRMEEILTFCVPPGVALRAEVRSVRRGSEMLYVAPSDDRPTTPSASGGRDAAKGLRLKPSGILRRWRLATLEFRPEFFTLAGVDATEGEGEIVAELAIRWDEPVSASTATHPHEIEPSWGWGRIASTLVSNPGGLELYQHSGVERPSGERPEITAPWKLVPGARSWARLRLSEEGLYRLNVDDLLAVGFEAEEVRPDKVRLFSRGEPVELLRLGEGASAEVYFWNDHRITEYSAERNFWVTSDETLPDPTIGPFAAATPADGVKSMPRTTRTARWEIDNELLVQEGSFLAVEGMEWVDRHLKEGETYELELEIEGYEPPKTSLEARVGFYVHYPEGVNQGGRFEVSLGVGGQALKPISLAALSRQSRSLRHEVAVAPDLIADGKNKVTLRLEGAMAGSADIPASVARNLGLAPELWLDYVEIDYPSRPILTHGRLELNDAAQTRGPQRWTALNADEAEALEAAIAVVVGPEGKATHTTGVSERDGAKGIAWPGGVGYRVEAYAPEAVAETPKFEAVRQGDLEEAPGGVDYLVISHREFMDIAEQLVALRRRQGLRARIVDVQLVYDFFSHGELSPVALRDFLSFTLENWSEGAPTYVVLVGDASSDYLNLARNEVKNWVPSYTYDFRGDRWASDHWLTLAAGQDDLGDFLIGRISVSSREDAQTVIEKIVDYEEKPKRGPWRARLGYVADDGEFPPVVEQLRTELTPPAFEAVRTYLDEKTPLEDNWYLDPEYVAANKMKVSPVATARIIRSFEKGMAFLTYYGHGSPNIWMDERVWFGGDSKNSDNLHLVDLGYCAFVANMTCNTGAIDYPVPKWNISISEDMLRVRNGGAIALFVPSGPSVTAIHQKMSAQLRRALFRDGLRRFGELTMVSRTRYALLGHPQQLTYMFISLGDPATDFQITRNHRSFTPSKKYYRPGERVRIDLVELEPDRGRYVVSLADESGDKIWSAEEAEFSGGRVTLDVPMPAQGPLGEVVLRVYAWDEDTGEEVAASANLEIRIPEVEISKAAARREPGGRARIEMVIHNRAPVGVREGRVEILRLNGARSGELFGRKTFTLGADAATTLALTGDGGRGGGATDANQAETFEIRVDYGEPRWPARLGLQRTRQRVALAPESRWVGLIPELSWWEDVDVGRVVRIEVAAQLGEGPPGAWSVGLSDLEGGAIKSQPFAPAAAESRAYLTLRGAEIDRATSGTLWLSRLGEDRGAMVSEVAVLDIPHHRARLRIDPSSVVVEPQEPSEGETIFIHFEVENAGRAISSHFVAGLYDGDPEAGGKALESHLGEGRARMKPLKGGERRAATLRWDPVPFRNAGERTIRIALEAGRIAGTEKPEGLTHEVKIHVRSKAILARGATTRSQRDIEGELKYFLRGEVINKGETEARNIIVEFYRSETVTPENRIGEYLIEVVPPQGSVIAEVPWEPDPQIDFVEGVEQPAPYHRLVIKDSQRRIVRLAEEL